MRNARYQGVHSRSFRDVPGMRQGRLSQQGVLLFGDRKLPDELRWMPAMQDEDHHQQRRGNVRV
jgi:hypothetical protein